MVPNVVARQAAKRLLGVRDTRWLRFASRLPNVGWYAVVLAASFVVARRRGGEVAASLAVLAAGLDPNLIANAAVATVDEPYAALTLLTLAAGLRVVERPTLGRGAAAGAALGLAFATKFTAFLLLPGLFLFPLLFPELRKRLLDASARALLAASAAIVVALAVIAASYRFHDLAIPLRDVAWRSGIMQAIAAAVPSVRLPVPVDFLTGFDILLVTSVKPWPVVVLGRHYPQGVWFYFLVVWLLKEPILVVAGQVYGIVRSLTTRLVVREPALGCLVLNAALPLLYFSLLFTTQIGFRFVLMCVPLVDVVASVALAPLATTAGGRRTAVLAFASALAMNSLYLGNHLAFTNEGVWPKREAFRLLTNANIDWGQNEDKLEGWLAARGLQDAHVDPVHILPGDNVMSVNQAAGAGKFEQHAWLRAHMSPRGHLGHTFLWFPVDAAAYDRFLEEARRLVPGPLDARRCAAGEEAAPLASGDPAVLPELGGSEALVLCVSVGRRIDLGLHGLEGTVVFGPAALPLRDQTPLRPGRESWYRLEPGTSALAVTRASGFRGTWELKGGGATLAVRPAPVEKGVLRPPD